MPGIQAVGVTHYRIKMVDDSNKKKESEMRRTEPILRLSGTQLLKYGDFHRYYCVLKALNALNCMLERDFKFL